MPDLIPFLVSGLGLMMLLMLSLWTLQLFTKNAGIVDAGWAFGIAALAAFDAWQGWGWFPRRLAAASLAGLWGLRLGLYILLTRVVGKPEEGRYQQLRKEWKKNIRQKFLFFFEFQALLCVVFSLPFLLACVNEEPGFTPLEKTALALWACAFLGVCLADRQLHRFKQGRRSKGKTCRAGFWAYSRHPNYFFEWLLWCANALFALSSPSGAWAFLCPALLLYLLFKVTGIPATEEQALRTRGKDYRDYQKTTSVFVPLPPRPRKK